MSNKWVKYTIFLLAMVLLISCGKRPEVDESMFEVGIDELTDIKVGEPFEIHGFIINQSKYSWDIRHGAGMFTYRVFDQEGNQIPYQGDDSGFLFRNDIGFMSKLEAGEVYPDNASEHRSSGYYEFVIDEPGEYTVQTEVTFKVIDGEVGTDLQVSSDIVSFWVEK